MADGRALFDDAVKRRIALERYSTAEARKALKFLKELEDDLIGRLAVLRTGAGSRSGKIRLKAQENLLASIKDASADIYERLEVSLRKGMTQLAGAEHGRAQDALASAAGDAGLNVTTQRLTGTAAFEIAAARPMQGALLEDWLADLEPRHRDRIERALRISFAEGESLETAAGRLRDAGLQNGRGLEALIRTSNAHIAAQVDQAVTEANADIIEGVEWVAVLDGRTTDICRSRDGKVYPIDSGPRPPAHIGCRSTTRKILKGLEPLPRETYGEWLKRQPAATQDDILGPTRGKLFRSGKMTVDRFVDMKGKTLTLDQLAAQTKAKPKAPAVKRSAEQVLADLKAAVPNYDAVMGQAGEIESILGDAIVNLDNTARFTGKNPLDTAQRKLLGVYSSNLNVRSSLKRSEHFYSWINKQLRSGAPTELARNIGRDLAAAIAARPAVRKTIYRGTGRGTTKKLSFYTDLQKSGGTFVRAEVSSWSTKFDVAEGFVGVRDTAKPVLEKIVSPKRAKSLRAVSLSASEDEAVFAPGARFKVTGVNELDRYVEVTLEEVD
jgi:SPP1 gp7 family putative phage head morphogenesis protein